MDLTEGGQSRNHLPMGETPGQVLTAADHGQMPPFELGLREIGASKTPDKCKRDEWSEGGVLTLLKEYESKWLLRNRAKLKGSDWEDIARLVSDRKCGTKGLKTPNQCKNKIESMKKRYRAESAGASNPISGSSWQFYGRMDALLKGTYCSQAKGGADCTNGVGESSLQALPKVEMGDLEHVLRRVSDIANPQTIGKTKICDNVEIEAEGRMQDSNQDDGSNTLPNCRKESRDVDSDVRTPRSKFPNAIDGSGKVNPFKRRKSASSDVADSIRMLAHSMLKIEQARMEMYKESERLRADAEIKRSEMELKRTEIIAKTQLQIAKLLSKRPRRRNNRSGSSSLRTEPSMSPSVPMNDE
ncbi:uncharacterized protein LOC143879638 [Tasmannia lanceolata]|uniref:uncharacterized protein LOC143879638 n=1 Tax=Tasmannia lanceolata TaxID=3420 RepID=UPI004063671B